MKQQTDFDWKAWRQAACDYAEEHRQPPMEQERTGWRKILKDWIDGTLVVVMWWVFVLAIILLWRGVYLLATLPR